MLFLVLIILVGCNGKENAEKGDVDIKGVITDIDSGGNRILVEDVDTGLVWIALNENDAIENYKKGQEVVIWVVGGIDTSSPAYAEALNIETLAKEEPSLPKFNFKSYGFPPEITGFILSGESSYQMAGGAYEWDNGKQAVITDYAGPTQLAEGFEAIVLEPGSQVSIEIKQNPYLQLYLWTSDEKRETLEGDDITVPANKGRYIYEVLAQWSNGNRSFTVVIEVK